METAVVLLILGVISGLSHGAGVIPDLLNAAVGGSVTFTTTLTPPERPFLAVSWTFVTNGSTTNIITSTSSDIVGPVYQDRITFIRSTASLELRNLVLSDRGEYRVNIVPDVGAALTGDSRLEIYLPVSNVVVTPNTTDLSEFSSSVSLSCSSSGSSLSFLWLNGSSEVSASEGVQLGDGGSTLTIVSVTRYDEGPFTCRVSNPVSNAKSAPVSLSINFGPENTNLILSPSKEYYEEGSNIILSCSADSRPAALFHWALNGSLLSDTGPELRLNNIQMRQSGNYSCQAHNSKTLRYQTSQPSLVTVLEWRKDGSPLNNDITLHDEGRLLSFSALKRTDRGEYSCKVSNPISSEEAKYNMVVNFGFVSPAYKRRISLNTTTGYLELRDLTLSDSGVYTVDITTHTDKQLNGSISLEVYAPPLAVSIAPNTTDLLEFSSSVSLSCSSSGSSLSFLWLNGSSEVSASEGVQLGDGGSTLTIVSVTRYDQGPFRCNVSNPIGHGISHPLTLNISYGPEKASIVGPSSAEIGTVTLLYCSATSVPAATFSWLFNGNQTDVHGAAYVIPSSSSSDYGKYTWGYCTKLG
ncbi:cell adhesion molecule CEACAM5-like [Centroberyx affinis]|uniref:cell adhesion molecule CEACAM5-like n=1 Tax=Centroberyx affinis TaxID=166261 RepID=UPI003A5C54FF